VHELTEVQVHAINEKIRYLKKKSFADATLLMAGLAGSVQTRGWSLLASAHAAVNGYKTVQEYFQNTRQNPAFFLWKILNKKD
jgi:SRSO17 transposase